MFKNWKASGKGIKQFGPNAWAKIVLAMGTKVNFASVPDFVRDAIQALGDDGGVQYCTDTIRAVDVHHFIAVAYVHVPNHGLGESMEGLYFYVPAHHPIVKPKVVKGEEHYPTVVLPFARKKKIKVYPIPSVFVVARHNGNLTIFSLWEQRIIYRVVVTWVWLTPTFIGRLA